MNRWERDLGLDTNENKNASLSQLIYCSRIWNSSTVSSPKISFSLLTKKSSEDTKGEGKKQVSLRLDV